MKNLQINSQSVGQQSYNLVEKVADDVNIFRGNPLANLVNIPEGLSIIDGSGNIIAADDYSSWNEGMGLTGIGVNSLTGIHSDRVKFIFAVADAMTDSHVDDGLISTQKHWSQNLYGTDIPGLTKYEEETQAENNFSSRSNTDAIIKALGETLETDNAAVVCRNYSAGIIGQGMWDLPALGILKTINDLKNSIQTLMTNINKSYWNLLFTSDPLASAAWSSTIRSSEYVYDFNFYNSMTHWGSSNYNFFVIPVCTIDYQSIS